MFFVSESNSKRSIFDEVGFTPEINSGELEAFFVMLDPLPPKACPYWAVRSIQGGCICMYDRPYISHTQSTTYFKLQPT